MSLPDYTSHPNPSSAPGPPSSVVQLNVGGHIFHTFLSTLRKHPDSYLAELFSVPSKLPVDAQGRYFMDRDGSHFGSILEFLRSERLPAENLREVHREALYYNIQPLVKLLEDRPELFGETVGREQFLSRVPHYKENIQVLIRVARAEAVAARHSSMLICVLRTEEDLGFYDDAVASLAADKESVVIFGPWKAAPSVVDLLDCIQTDIRRQGYRVTVQRHAPEKSFLFRSYDFFYKVVFTWW